MLAQDMSRGQQSRAHLLCLKALDAPIERPKNAKDAASAALAECTAIYANNFAFNLYEVFALAEAIALQRDVHCQTPAAVYDVETLVDAVDLPERALLALRLCGAYRDPETDCWRDGEGETTLITFPPDFFKSFLLGWANYA